jgi:hypothetical protein
MLQNPARAIPVQRRQPYQSYHINSSPGEWKSQTQNGTKPPDLKGRHPALILLSRPQHTPTKKPKEKPKSAAEIK